MSNQTLKGIHLINLAIRLSTIENSILDDIQKHKDNTSRTPEEHKRFMSLLKEYRKLKKELSTNDPKERSEIINHLMQEFQVSEDEVFNQNPDST